MAEAAGVYPLPAPGALRNAGAAIAVGVEASGAPGQYVSFMATIPPNGVM